GRINKTAFIDDADSYSYGELAIRVNRSGNTLLSLGLSKNDRVAMVMLDTIDFPAVFWGAIKAGVIPVPLNTLLTTTEYEYILSDSGATALIVSDQLYPVVEPVLDKLPDLKHVIIDGNNTSGRPQLSSIVENADSDLKPVDSLADDIAFWLYSSGSTGNPKGVMHRHENLYHTANLYGKGVLGIREDDTVYSAAKLFYGLGNAMTFPLFVGATAILCSGRPTPLSIMDTIQNNAPTIYYGVPGLYASTLASIDGPVSSNLRLCVSAGEPLPDHIGRDWETNFNVPILDGIGSTEMLHIYLSHDDSDDYYGTTGIPVAGYEIKLINDKGNPVSSGEIGELLVKGPSVASGYWQLPERTRSVFKDGWLHSGDKYIQNEKGYYVYSGRKDDMFKVSGQWVSPFEVESAITQHKHVLEAAVIAREDDIGLLKPMAYVVLRDDINPTEKLAYEIKQFVKDNISRYKY
ncbi:MAG: benzoate-CoA ligase family protein, partial [Gammaproteobacteria bacterium]|nr:benzoate-CoA ligase family protein [Gammaproteobacteria bacterium]